MFKKAERKAAKIKLAVTGPTGSGKTYSALRLAKGLGGKIAVIDAENGSASLYSDQFDFDVLDLRPPFTTEKYIEAINAAEKAGYTTIVIDSLTHAWAGEGGLLEQKALLDSRPGSNHWTNWGPIDKKDQSLKNAFLHSTCHVIATMRSKMEYGQSEENGKKKVQKVGMAPIQRDGLSYEFTIVFDVAMDHMAEASKDRTGVFDGKIFKITEETGEILKNWLATGKPIESGNTSHQSVVETLKVSLPEAKKAETPSSVGLPIVPKPEPILETSLADRIAKTVTSVPVAMVKLPPAGIKRMDPNLPATLEQMERLQDLAIKNGFKEDEFDFIALDMFKVDSDKLTQKMLRPLASAIENGPEIVREKILSARNHAAEIKNFMAEEVPY